MDNLYTVECARFTMEEGRLSMEDYPYTIQVEDGQLPESITPVGVILDSAGDLISTFPITNSYI